MDVLYTGVSGDFIILKIMLVFDVSTKLNAGSIVVAVGVGWQPNEETRRIFAPILKVLLSLSIRCQQIPIHSANIRCRPGRGQCAGIPRVHILGKSYRTSNNTEKVP